jgi:type IV pilus assembly protein PilB
MENIFTHKKKLGELLIESGLLKQEHLLDALQIQKKTGKQLGQVLVENNFVKPSDLAYTLSRQMGVPHVWIRKGLVDSTIIDIIPYEKARAYQIMPLFKIRNTLTIASANPQNVILFDELTKLTGCAVQPVLCRTDDIKDTIEEYYREKVHMADLMDVTTGDEIEIVERTSEEDLQTIEEMAEGSPVINFVNTILLKAIKDRASDIHLEPDRTKFRVRFRIDGVLYEAISPKLELHPSVVSRLKIMAGLDIAERRLPQDGRIQVVVHGQFIDMRFSSLPGIFGEKVVLRVLDKSNAILDISKLGFREGTMENFKALLKRPYGLILTTGPTGSGKTTTLYGAVCFLNNLEKNIVTIEDPVEYQLDIINQNQTNDAIGLSFASFLKHVLRQDPDIIMVGEIRDKETAEIAIQAALTGHLVLSTLHTNDACGAVTRLLDMGIEPFMISSAVIGVMGQRLIRTICPECKTPYFPSSAVSKQLGLDHQKNIKLFKGKGCEGCYDSGFKGRMGIYELLSVDQDLQRLILQRPSSEQLTNFITQHNIKTVRDEGLEKIKEGFSTIEEVNRAIFTEA